MSIKKFDVDNNEIMLFSDDNFPESESLIKEGRLFYVGKHKGREYTTDDLDKIAKNFNDKEGIPVQLDHSTSAKDTVGLVRSVERRGNELFGKMEFLGKDIVDKVRLGLWKKVSVGLSLKHPDMKLQEVSITPFPALANAQVFTQEENQESNINKEEIKESEVKKMAEKMTDENKVNMAEFETFKAEFAQMKQEKEALENRIKFKEDQEIIEQFVNTGKTTPAMRESELKLYNSLNDEQRVIFSEIKTAQPAIMPIGTVNNVVFAKKPGEITDEDAEREANKLLGIK